MPKTPCPYCGQPHDSSDVGRCQNCNGLFEPLSRIATQLAMGPWYVRDEDRPFMPGFNDTILRQQVASGRINANTILRGPTTNQFWMTAGKVPGVSRLMGTCHACDAAVSPKDTTCKSCQADLSLPEEVDHLGLMYTNVEQRAQAQQEMSQRRAAKSKPKPADAKAMQGSTVVDPDLLKPVKPKPVEKVQATQPEPEEEEETLVDALAEDVWHAGPTSSTRRRKRRKGADPLVMGMGVLFLCVIAIGLVVLIIGGGKSPSGEEEPQTQEPNKQQVQRDRVAVARVSVPAITAYERLEAQSVPEPFEEQYKTIRRLMQQAEIDHKAERYNEAFEAYQQAGELVTPLENEIAAWQANQLAKAEATELRDRVTALRQKAMASEAERWAAKDWQAGEAAWAQAEQHFTSSKFVEASELMSQAESTYLIAENKALAGQVAGKAQEALNEAVKASTSEQALRKFANDQIDAMFRYRAEANQQLKDQQYAQAEQSYNNALDALREARQIVELAQYKKFYAFDAGFRASELMLTAARGEGVDASAQSELASLFDKLRILPNPATGITPGDEVGFTVAIQPLINDARDAIAKMHGPQTQACYLAGFHASIIDQTLKTNALTDDQQKRIHQSLGTIEKAAEEAGWDIDKLRPIFEQVRVANRNAKLREEPASIRSAWKRLIDPIRVRESASNLMDPVASPTSPNDPELFPERGT